MIAIMTFKKNNLEKYNRNKKKTENYCFCDIFNLHIRKANEVHKLTTTQKSPLKITF